MTESDFILSQSVINVLMVACPFLVSEVGVGLDEGSTVIFGDVARLMKEGLLTTRQIAAVFELFNELGEKGTDYEVTVLVTGALELFNDDASSQRMARQHLQGAALKSLEEARVFFGQPDYGLGGQA